MVICDICGKKLDINQESVVLWAYVGKSTTPHSKQPCHLCRDCENELYERKRKVEADFFATRTKNV